MIFPPGKCSTVEVFETRVIQGCFLAISFTIAAVESVELSSTTTTLVGGKD